MISRNLRAALFGLLLMFSAAAVACDQLPLLAPTMSTITLSAASTTVQANGSTTVTASVLEVSGTPVQNGTLVSFTTTVGQITPADARTSNGRVTVTFSGAGQSGEAQIRANSGGAKTADPLLIKVGGAAASRIQLTATPSTVPSGGGSSVITALVSDANGNSLSSVQVAFSTTAGNLSSTIVSTDASGQAQTTLTTNREATVTATAGAAATGTTGTSGTVIVRVNVLPGLSITPPTGTVTAGVPASFTVTASTPTGASPFRDVMISFGDGQTLSLGAVTASVTVPHTYSSAGTYTVSASGVDSDGNVVSGVSTSVTVAARLQPTVTIAASATPSEGSTTTFTITANPAASSGAVIQNVTVNFGDGSTADLGATTGSTTVQHVYQSSGTYTVTATARDSNGGTASASTVIIVQPVVVSITFTNTLKVFSFTAVLPMGTSGASFEWDFGDGSRATTTGNMVTKIYTTSGSTPVTVTVTTTVGTTARGSTVVNVP